MSEQIAWIGLGNMGAGMCKNIVEKTRLRHPILIYDMDEQRAHNLHTRIVHTEVVSSIAAAAARADIIFYSVPDDKAVFAVLTEILSTGISGKLIVDCSTVHPDTTNQESKMVDQHGGHFVACPVFGAAAMADAGQLICILAGNAEDTAKVKPFTTGVMGKATIDFTGEEPGKATMMKIIGNTFVLNMVESLSEGHVLAEKSGLGTAQLHKFIEIMFPGPYTAYSTRMLTGDYYTRERPLFGVDMARKDARHALSLAQKAGMTMKHVELADVYLKVVQEQKGSQGELAAMYGAKRLESGLTFQNQK
ncbi:6-phosphogluconate dehydrogenase [Talaromyces proteolyticus]|uniref:6-phosphogluconate dehydrogenase n=1 Tax=Talaromyces proteolyticus TaxID=1131652 RepID=A0AAD4KHP2_9EURO|nr:6-phosphogluconate dehydrogenase [Talaromyces proteolyticus]KAH8692359.1 6-phosphogluconate dehydrogenase [Talaromyces proteolyticus]